MLRHKEDPPTTNFIEMHLGETDQRSCNVHVLQTVVMKNYKDIQEFCSGAINRGGISSLPSWLVAVRLCTRVPATTLNLCCFQSSHEHCRLNLLIQLIKLIEQSFHVNAAQSWAWQRFLEQFKTIIVSPQLDRVMNGHQLFRCPRRTIARTTGARRKAVEAALPRALPFDLAGSCPCGSSRVTQQFVVNHCQQSISIVSFQQVAGHWALFCFCFLSEHEGHWAHRAPHERRDFRRCCTRRTNPWANTCPNRQFHYSVKHRSFQVSAS